MSQPLRLNLGCGTLIVLVLAVVVLSKLVPHGSRTKDVHHAKSEDMPMSTRHTEHRIASSSLTPKASEKTPTPTKESANTVTPHQDLGNPNIFQGLNALISSFINLDAEKSAPSLMDSISAKKAVDNYKSIETQGNTQKESPKADLKALALVEASQKLLGTITQLADGDNGTKPQSPESEQKTAPESKTTAPLSGEVVFNNPWDNSVDQVSRYLKRHTHDASSLEITEWGKVQRMPHGFSVRCSFRSINVLGKSISQSRNFILNAAGEIKEIRD